LQDAIRAAVKFDSDCTKFFKYTDNYSEDLRVAVELASKANAGFTEITIRKAHHRLGIAMR